MRKEVRVMSINCTLKPRIDGRPNELLSSMQSSLSSRSSLSLFCSCWFQERDAGRSPTYGLASDFKVVVFRKNCRAHICTFISCEGHLMYTYVYVYPYTNIYVYVIYVHNESIYNCEMMNNFLHLPALHSYMYTLSPYNIFCKSYQIPKMCFLSINIFYKYCT
jgi:hypothetical protein